MDNGMSNFRRRLQAYKSVVLSLFLTFGLVVLAEMRLFPGFGEYPSYYLTNSIFVIGLLLSLAAFLNKYLSEDKAPNEMGKVEPNDTMDEAFVGVIQRVESGFREEIIRLQKSIQKTRDDVLRQQSGALDVDVKERLVSALKDSVYSSASDELLDELKEKSTRLIDAGTRDRLERNFSRIMKRLSVEIGELGKRAKVNLIIGSITALAGVAIFTLFVFDHASIKPSVVPEAPVTLSVPTVSGKSGTPGASDTSTQAASYLATEFAPRISLVIVIELFAYFFLGLYRNNLSEIKYFHNELTNVESRYVALEEAIASTDKEMIKEILKELSKTERNFLLKKGESTVSLEDKRLTSEDQKGIINALISSINNAKK